MRRSKPIWPRANAAGSLRDLLERQNFRLGFWRDAGERINWRRFFDITELAALACRR